MTNLDQVWQAWRALSRVDRARFLIMLRDAYARDREAVVRQHGIGADGVRVSRLSDLSLREADLQRPGP